MPPTLNSTDRKTGRNATILMLVIGLAGALTPMLANMDLTSTAGVVAALLAVAPVVVKYLDGWQKYEARLDGPVVAAPLLSSPNGRPPADLIVEEPDVPDPPADDELEGDMAAVGEPDA